VLSARPILRSQIKLFKLVAQIAFKAVSRHLVVTTHGSSRSLQSIAPLYLSNDGPSRVATKFKRKSRHLRKSAASNLLVGGLRSFTDHLQRGRHFRRTQISPKQCFKPDVATFIASVCCDGLCNTDAQDCVFVCIAHSTCVVEVVVIQLAEVGSLLSYECSRLHWYEFTE
jgi:hypothetical protein